MPFKPETKDLRGDAYINSCDLIARLNQLNKDREEAESETELARSRIKEIEDLGTEATLDELVELDELKTSFWTNYDGVEYILCIDFDEDTDTELRALESLADEASGYSPDWRYGSTLIREDKFLGYAQQLAKDTGAIDKNAKWPLQHIDWEAAAEELKQDYTEVEFDGTNYFIQ